jgi:hypothetical protein
MNRCEPILTVPEAANVVERPGISNPSAPIVPSFHSKALLRAITSDDGHRSVVGAHHVTDTHENKHARASNQDRASHVAASLEAT